MSGRLAAALLVGGKSVRMGRDKAFIEWQGRPLWRHQLGILRALGPDEVFLCIGNRSDFNGDGSVMLSDDPAHRGPMAGIAAALAATDCEWLLVLAIDLPEMTPQFLKRMTSSATVEGRGQVFERGGYFEGLAAVYGEGLSALAAEVAGGLDPSVQNFVRLAAAADEVQTRPLPAWDEWKFRNLNTPDS